jgi:hypothetical protein
VDWGAVIGAAVSGTHSGSPETRRFALDGCLVMKGRELAVLLGSSDRK